MGNVRQKLYGIIRRAGPALLAGCALFPAVAPGAEPRNNPVKHASDYTSVEYFDPPNGLQISSRITGAEAIPLPGNRLVMLKQFRLETFATNGTPESIVEAPDCVYDQFSATANSAGPLKIRQADGQVELDGVGFLWRRDDEFLTISNQVHTIIKTGPNLKFRP